MVKVLFYLVMIVTNSLMTPELKRCLLLISNFGRFLASTRVNFRPYHYENMPMQYTTIFTSVKIIIFR